MYINSNNKPLYLDSTYLGFANNNKPKNTVIKNIIV